MSLAGLYVGNDDGDLVKVESLLTKRELFAAMAMQGLLSTGQKIEPHYHPNKDRLLTSGEVISGWSVDYADALIKALEPKDTGE